MKRKMSLLGLICLFTSILMAQTKISGTVTDVDKNPLPGVSVVCKSTSQGTVTNLDGKYTIEINKGNTLTFSLIGMQTQDIKIASQSIINVIMHVKSAKRKNRFSKTKLKSQIGKSPKRKRPVSRHTHKNRTAFERLSNGIQTLFFFCKKDSKKHCQFSKNSYLYIVLERVLPLQFFAIS